MTPQTIPDTSTWQARLDLVFSRKGTRTILSGQHHAGPLLVQRSLYPEGPQVCHVAVLHPPSGIAGGDEIDIDIHVAQAAHATLTTPGATRWYKANGRKARQTIHLSVEAGARLDWLPMENIFYEQADATNQTEIALESGACAIGWEISQLGSILKDSHWQSGQIRSALTLRIGDRLLWVEQGTVTAADAWRTSMAGLAGLPVYATLWCFGPTLTPASAESLSARMPWREDLRAGMTVISYDTVQSLHLVRCTGLHAEDVRNLLIEAWMILRRGVLGVGGTPLRLWST